MARPGDEGRHSNVRFEIKGSVLRGFLQGLAGSGLRDRVIAELDEESRRMAVDPPLASEWIDGRLLFELNAVTLDLFGPELLEKVTLEGNRAGLSKLVTFGVESALRLFGVSPATLFRRMGPMSSTTSRGIDYDWTDDGPRAGTLRATYVHGRDVPRASWISMRGGLRMVFDYCDEHGSVGEPLVVGAARNACDFALRW